MSIAVSGKAVGDRVRVILGVVAAAVFATLVLVGCGGGDDDEDGSRDSSLVLSDGEAWTATIDGEKIGFIFNKSYNDSVGEREYKDLIMIVYKETDGWSGGIAGTWSTSGNKITLIIEEETMTGTFSGNTWTITIDGKRHTFTKTNNITYTTKYLGFRFLCYLVECDGPAPPQGMSSYYLVTFDPNANDEWVYGYQRSKEALDGRLDYLPVPRRNGYYFDGWYTAPTGGDEITEDWEFSEDTTIYAHWTPYGDD
jgi:uncharacterized repeat protein (TIGR02543 family)